MKFLELLPPSLREAVELGRAAVVGGAVRAELDGSKLKDVDVFVFDRETYTRLVETSGAAPLAHTDGFVHRVDGDVPTDIILAEGETPQSMMTSGDFDIACGVYVCGELLLPSGYRQQIAERKMRFLRSRAPEHSYNRFQRYTELGYQIDESIWTLLAAWRAEAEM